MFQRFFQKPAKGHQGSEANDDDALLSEADIVTSRFARKRRRRHDSEAKIAVKTTFICSAIYLSITILVCLVLKDAQFVDDIDVACLNHVSSYSPIVKEVKPGWHVRQYNGSFLHETVYRQAAGPEVDAAWAALGADYRSVVIPASEAEKTGIRSDQVKISQIYGGGFPANVEGLHHIHCLNLLRKALWWNYEYYRDKKEGAFSNTEYIVRYHVTHCLDILRQQLMCVTDVGVLGQVWWQAKDMAKPLPFVDFNTRHKCRDFEAIRKWAEERQLPPESDVDMSLFYEQPAPGDRVLPAIP
ncbi:hypothetical protein BU24DRAFT_492479 [Aaosphaeria arxii CBS 175.79]|uniref:Tat pathway signal sequence n=1 Tax=Aaosphaeria arxii CBS 175.79 TaxID=1450172 RepID=A0A6A5XTV3_9PLEO|nr:uncharacterized protein BU24DRAFT_492479 [Aaosphaeria arxii CBS 175.79]KAF2016383.1 hypothetical protein BU24DRAFT_492479 [Aaosphaeria arxii CBS 175.79]